MPIELSTSACCLPKLERAELFAAARQAGYPGVELFCGFPSKYDPATEASAALQPKGEPALKVTALHLPKDVEGGKRAVELAAKAGVPQLIAHGNGAPADAGTWLAPVVAHAREYGVEIVVTNHKGQSIESADDVATVLKACGEHAPSVLLEAGHYWAVNHSASDALARFAERVKLVHVKDLDADGHSVPFGTGVSPLSQLCEELASTGYEGRICVELEMRELPTDEVIRLLDEARWKMAEWLGATIAS